jgi:hypothetical protein
VREALDALEPVELPAGCSVELSLEAKDLLARLFRVGGADEVERVYRELRLEPGKRPSAGELERMGTGPPASASGTGAGSTSCDLRTISPPMRSAPSRRTSDAESPGAPDQLSANWNSTSRTHSEEEQYETEL